MSVRKESEERFYCPVSDCGRSFTFKDEMLKHVERRHPDLPPESSIPEPPRATPNPVAPLDLFPELEEKFEPKGLTRELLLSTTQMDSLEDITALVLRNEDLTEFNSAEGVDVEDLVSLQSLSLAHNHVRDLNGVGYCLSLQELNINNNIVQSLGPLESLIELRKLYAANNYIREVVSLRALRKLSVLNLFKNKLYDLDTSLKVLRELSLTELWLDRNPCMLQVQNARFKVIRYLKVTALDGDEVTDIDREIACDIFSLDESSLPAAGGFVKRLRLTAESEQKRELSDLYRELDQLYSENEELRKENAAFKQQVGRAVASTETEALQQEVAHLKREVANVYILLDENQELRRRLDTPLDENELMAELAAENERLKTRTIDLEDKLAAVKKTQKRPQTSAGVIRPRTSAGVRTTSLMEVEETPDEELEQLFMKNSESLREMRKMIREMNGEGDT